MVSRGTTQQSSAPYNRRIVLDVIRRQGTISRREIVGLVSLSPQAADRLRDAVCIIENMPDGPPAAATVNSGPDTTFTLPPASITVLRGKVAMREPLRP
jgi:hypothetical protein